jgi:integrase
MKLTEKCVAKLEPGTSRVHFLDDDVTGFGVRIDPDGRRSFFWRAKVNGVVRFRALGEFPSVSVGDARTDAIECNGKAAEWKRLRYEGADPFEKKKRLIPTTVPTFQELVEAYIAEHVHRHASKPEKAEANVRSMLKTHFSAWTNRKIDSLTVHDMLAVKKACGEHHFAANRCVELIRGIFNWSAKSRDGKINYWPVENPAKSVELYDEKSRDVFLQPEQLVRFHECLKDEPNADLKDFLTLAMATGARKGDIYSMRWEDWQREREVWTVPFPKNGESYDINLMPAAIEVLERRHAQAEDSAVYVFPGPHAGKPLRELRKPWDTFRKRAGIPDIHVHDLRRTVGSYLAVNGTPLQQIAAALGHRSMQSTLVYARLQSQAIIEARQGAEAKMQQLMKDAQKRLKATTPKQLKAAKA